LRVHYLQHGPFEDPGVITTWAAQKGYNLTGTRVDLLRSLPDVHEFDVLILMGGPCSLRQPYVKEAFSKEFCLLQKTYELNKPVLGICLGAQLIAESLGAQTLMSPHTEVGVFPVVLLPASLMDSVFSLYPTEFDALHLHSDMFALPEGATLLASSEACPHQAFRVGDRIYGIQYHLEKTKKEMKEILELIEIPKGTYVATIDELKQYMPDKLNQLLLLLLDYLVGIVASAKEKI
jgi:GMP synthase (glutamine-hydrolysing)